MSGNFINADLLLFVYMSLKVNFFTSFKLKEHSSEYKSVMLFLSFRRVLNVIYSFLGNSPASDF